MKLDLKKFKENARYLRGQMDFNEDFQKFLNIIFQGCLLEFREFRDILYTEKKYLRLLHLKFNKNLSGFIVYPNLRKRMIKFWI